MKTKKLWLCIPLSLTSRGIKSGLPAITSVIFLSHLCNHSLSQGSWTQKANFAGTARRGAVGFSIGTKGYIGTGNDGVDKQDFWEWDQSANTWTQKANFGGTARGNAVGFSIGTKGYIGVGFDGANKQDFWEWDQSTNIWTQKAIFGGTARAAAVGFSIGTKGYIGAGFDGADKQDFWEWDQSANTWTQKANFGGTARRNASGFSIGTKGYIGMGLSGSTYNPDFWEWDQSTNIWTQKANFGGAPRALATAFSFGGNGYIGLGSQGPTYYQDLWEYNPVANSWTQKANFVGTATTGAVGFSIGTKGYVGTGFDITFKNDFWEFIPTCNLTLSVTTTNSACGQATGTASVVATGGTSPYTYIWTNGDKTSLADTLSAGLYMVVVTDANGCTAQAPAMISDAGAPTITVTSVTNVSCYGGNNGAINISVTGGVSPYTYFWANGNTTQNMSNLQAGPHQIQVIAANGCIANTIINVTEPSPLSITDSIRNASCGNPDGAAYVFASGGTFPYSYLWNTGATTQSISNIAAGSYSVTVTDNKGCTKSVMGVVVNLGAATVTLDSIKSWGCNSGLGSIYISVTGGTPPYTYAWTNGATTQDITGIMPGNYGVTVYSNGNPCTGAFSATIPSQTPPAPVICIVTVDTATGKNQCLFVKDSIANPGLLKYNFYRETTTAGVYQLLGSKLANQLSLWTDQSANPLQRAWRYKVTAVDTCGHESPVSVFHKTIHLAANLGLSNTVNLIWDNYEGFPFGSYFIWRYDPVGGWLPLDTVPSNLNSYTDLTPPTLNNLIYYVEVKHPFGCNVNIKNPVPMTTINTTKSNTFKIGVTAVDETLLNIPVTIFPNPTGGVFNVQMSGLVASARDAEMKIYNIYGECIYQHIFTSTNQHIDLSNQPSGIYFLKLVSDKGTVNKKIVVQ